MGVARGVLWLSALTFAGFGAAFALFPRAMARLVEIELPTDTARIDFVATYGGLELGLAAFFGLCASRPDPVRVRLGLLASGLALGGFATARLAGALLADRPRPLLFALLAAEVSGAALSFWAAGRAAAGQPPPRPEGPT